MGLAAQYVKDVRGVKNVHNQITIVRHNRHWIAATRYPMEGGQAGMHEHNKKEHHMLNTIAGVLIVLWVLGLATSYTMGGLVHLLLVLSIIMVLAGMTRKKKTKANYFSTEVGFGDF